MMAGLLVGIIASYTLLVDDLKALQSGQKKPPPP